MYKQQSRWAVFLLGSVFFLEYCTIITFDVITFGISGKSPVVSYYSTSSLDFYLTSGVVELPGAQCPIRVYPPWFQFVFIPVMVYEITAIYLATNKAISQYGVTWFKPGQCPAVMYVLLRDTVAYPIM